MLRKILSLLFPPIVLDCNLIPLDIKQVAFWENSDLVTFFDYKNEQVKNLILTLKENESPELLQNLVEVIKPELVKLDSRLTSLDENHFHRNDKEHDFANLRLSRGSGNPGIYFVPVPARKQRLEEFGFNQTELFARALSKLIPHSKTIPLVYRIKEISKQAHKSKKEREEEINGTMNYKEAIPPEIASCSLFIIVDDVMTTGSTLREVYRVLQLAGAREILVVALARA